MTQATQLKRDHDFGGHDETHFGDHLVMQSFDYRKPAAHDNDPKPYIPLPDTWVRSARYCDQPLSWQSRLFGMGGTAGVFALILGAAIFTWQTVDHINATTSERLVVMELAPLAAPPEPVHEVPPGPEQVERQKEQPKPEPDVVVPTPLIQLPIPSRAVNEKREQEVEVVDPGPPVPETTAPKSIAAPAASRASNDAQPNWEGQILAHLERFRRYPARARAARQEGTAFLRFTMNREGQVLSATIFKKSGSFDLDRAALDTLQRAQPLPPIPAGRPDVVELTIPVEFYLRR